MREWYEEEKEEVSNPGCWGSKAFNPSWLGNQLLDVSMVGEG